MYANECKMPVMACIVMSHSHSYNYYQVEHFPLTEKKNLCTKAECIVLWHGEYLLPKYCTAKRRADDSFMGPSYELKQLKKIVIPVITIK